MKKKIYALVSFLFGQLIFSGFAFSQGADGSSDMSGNVGEEVKEAAKETLSFFHLDSIKEYFTIQHLAKLIIAVLSILIFYIVYRVIKRLVTKSSSKKFELHTQVLLRKIVSYVFYVFIAMYILNLFGVDLKAIWGAAGIAGLAIGFAAQTSVSNLISGIFVLTDKSMRIGDFIEVSGVSGTVDNIGLLSVKVHTLDNQLIRIPNSTIINNDLINYSHFPERRFVFTVPVSYDTDLKYALDVLRKVPERCSCVLENPEPSVFYDGFDEGITVKIAVWFKRENLVKAKNEVYVAIKELCAEYNVEIPYEHFDVTIKEESKKSAKSAIKTAEKKISAGVEKKAAGKGVKSAYKKK